MDHISLPRSPARQPIQLPYLGAEYKDKYDRLGFSGFPERKGFDVERLKRAEYQGEEWNEALSFFQEWCFFGMLIEIFEGSGLAVDIQDFIDKTNERVLLTTRLLPYYLRLWASHEICLSAGTKEKNLNSTDCRFAELHRSINSIAYAWGCLETDNVPSVDEFGRPITKIPSIARDTLLSITILGESLSYGRYQCYGVGIARPFIWTRCWFLDEWMLDSGWCRYEIARIEDKYVHHNTCSYYLSLLDRTYIDKIHNSCTWESCLADQIDETTYRTKHVQTSCTCSDGVEDKIVQQITQAVLENEIPIFTVSQCIDGTDTYKITVKRSDSQTPYVAISHVWSDGLGNNQRNSLPWCQLVRLQMLVDKLYEPENRPIPFWIDTICVPLAQLGRKSAILGLRQTYEEADKVLVLDRTLQEVIDEVEPTEILLRIACSSWVRRLWTFQEGALSKSLHFQFANQAVTYDGVRERQQKEFIKRVRLLCAFHSKRQGILDRIELKSKLESFVFNMSEAEDPVFFEADRQIHEFRNGLKEDDSDSTRLISLLKNIKWRTTSKPEDESICIANLLGQNTKDIISSSHQERMKLIFASLSIVPASVIFHDRIRIQETGSRWIPVSLLNSGIGSPITTDSRTAIPSSNGLSVTYPGLLLFPTAEFYQTESNSPICLEGNSRSMYMIHITGTASVTRDRYRGLQLAIIFEDFDDRTMEHVQKTRAILVTVIKHEAVVIFARIELCLLFEFWTSGFLPKNACRIDARALPQNQAWCVG